MQSVKTKDTGPEIKLRKALNAAGYRFRLHGKDLPGRPDIVFPGRRKAIFVHGCFWHGHDCTKGRASKSRTEYWGPKLEANKVRDARNLVDLERNGWESIVIWQCELHDMDNTMSRLGTFLGTPSIPIDKSKATG